MIRYRGGPANRRAVRSEGTIPAARFKAHCLALLNEVRERRTEYVITKHGKPVAKLVPCDEAPAAAFGVLAGTVIVEGDIVSPDPGAWEEKRPARKRRG